MSEGATAGALALDVAHMQAALELARSARRTSPPNPWVGCRLVAPDGEMAFDGATRPPGGAHAEIVALELAGDRARGATLYVTLEPCSHTGRTGPCADAIVRAGVERVVVALEDPDPQVHGRGLERLRRAGVRVELGLCREDAAELLAPYLKHRRTGRPFVILKLAATFDGKIADSEGESRWITGEEARGDVHRLRSESDAILVGRGTVLKDDPELTVRLRQGPSPERIVLGEIPEGANVEPAIAMSGNLAVILDELGRRGVLQLLVEGGASVAHDFHEAGLIDRYALYFAPALFGGDDATPMFRGKGAPSMSQLWRGKLRSTKRLGEDLLVVLEPTGSSTTPGGTDV